VVGAATFHTKDLQTFWKSFGVTRALPTADQVMEPVVTRITETILDTCSGRRRWRRGPT
jgi:kumamolisin